MSWFSENKFLAGFIGAVVVGVGGAAVLTFTASGKHTEALQEYESAQGELQDLQSQKPFPKTENLKLAEEEKKQTLATIQKLRSELAAAGFPMTEMNASDFQIELKKTLDSIAQKSAKSGLELPKEKFNLGFDYLSQLPDQAAAKPLGRELKAIAWVANQIIDGGAVKLEEIKREQIEEEKEPPKVDEKKKGKGAQKQSEEESLTRHDVFEVKFRAEESKARSILNNIVACKEQFFIPRRIHFENDHPTPPSKTDPKKDQPAEGGADGAKPASVILPVLGQEKVDVTLELEAVYFTAPEVKSAKKSQPSEGN